MLTIESGRTERYAGANPRAMSYDTIRSRGAIGRARPVG
jgi:hypothetical protein